MCRALLSTAADIDPCDADIVEATVTRFPERPGPDVEVVEVDLDQHPGVFRGEPLTEARAESVAADVLSRLPGRPSLSGRRERSPSMTVRLPAEKRARLDALAAREERRASDVVRDALDEYLARHAG